MSSSTTMEKLPPEILFKVLLEVTDLDTLASLLEASSTLWRLFDLRSSSAILERCLDSAYMDTDTKTVIRTIGYIREGCLPERVNSLETLRRHVTNDSITHRDCRGGNELMANMYMDYNPEKWYMRVDDIFSPNILPEHCSPATLRSILATIRSITFRTMTCLDSHLSRFRALKPRRAADPAWDPKDVKVAQLHEVPSIPMTIEDVGAPTWLEEQRVMRAFWRVQFVQDLRRAVRTGIVAWATGDLAELYSLSVPDIYDFPGIERDFNDASSEVYSRISSQELTDLTLIHMAEEHLNQHPHMPDPSWRRNGPDFVRPPEPPPPPEVEWGEPAQVVTRTDQDLLSDHWSTGSARFALTFKSIRGSQTSAMVPYRRLGVPIWCKERLDGYGLVSIPMRGSGLAEVIHDAAQNLLTWVTALGAEDVSSLVAAEKAASLRIEAARRGEPVAGASIWVGRAGARGRGGRGAWGRVR
ncbi:hypothetical protein K461DRAFT_65259 [Myriangium duriaei CBS 260.36]|uniref:F-box domain-containing protein n=1 Tax=Myriangium duriaei CBS 260.36 TaxID=1168546 RepID=A0A9P4IVA3_9PEZI|nr:hypothetical protein K461DRAFT_65259 [Myriangium duriaei CBS 260.36]